MLGLGICVTRIPSLRAIKDLGTIDKLIDNAEASYCNNKSHHPDLYIVSWARGGSKFTRNQPPPQGGFFRHYASDAGNSNSKYGFLVDTLALARLLEAKSVPSQQAEAITSAITQVLNDSLETISQSYVSKSETQKSEMLIESKLSNFKTEVQSSQENHFSMLHREIEKIKSELRSDNEKLRHEIEKASAEVHEIEKASAEVREDLQKVKVQLEAGTKTCTSTDVLALGMITVILALGMGLAFNLIKLVVSSL